MKLISISSFIFQIKDYVHESHNKERGFDLIASYDEFLKQILTFGMFFPCDEKGNVLTEPIYDPSNEQYWASEHFKYSIAKEGVLFKGVDLETAKRIVEGFTTIGSLTDYEFVDKLELTLTESAEKQIGELPL